MVDKSKTWKIKDLNRQQVVQGLKTIVNDSYFADFTLKKTESCGPFAIHSQEIDIPFPVYNDGVKVSRILPFLNGVLDQMDIEPEGIFYGTIGIYSPLQMKVDVGFEPKRAKDLDLIVKFGFGDESLWASVYDVLFSEAYERGDVTWLQTPTERVSKACELVNPDENEAYKGWERQIKKELGRTLKFLGKLKTEHY